MNEAAVDAWTAALVVAAFLLIAGVAMSVRLSTAKANRIRYFVARAVLSDAALILIGLLVILAIANWLAPYLRAVPTQPS